MKYPGQMLTPDIPDSFRSLNCAGDYWFLRRQEFETASVNRPKPGLFDGFWWKYWTLVVDVWEGQVINCL
jgi:hypothetical protein